MKRLLCICACIFAISLSACSSKALPTQDTLPSTLVSIPASDTPIPYSTLEPPAATPIPQPAPGIAYYYFVQLGEETPPAGSVEILPDELILAPTLAPVESSPDPASNIEAALGKMLLDSRNAWDSTDIDVTSVTFNDGAVEVALDGEYFAVGGIVQIAARDQILMTIFSESTVQTAKVMFNGKNIANLGSSSSRNAAPEDYTYTREEIESYMSDYAYQEP
ncbi:MAG: hypothetical protein C3F13_01215 [Anaerolineales bacterium]|nr:hypothetical protein [Anaerolineae bacterium]PWB56719.1 MAG: hypothetical protein C3F13_01215 [Anaerolineales bacterium]